MTNPLSLRVFLSVAILILQSSVCIVFKIQNVNNSLNLFPVSFIVFNLLAKLERERIQGKGNSWEQYLCLLNGCQNATLTVIQLRKNSFHFEKTSAISFFFISWTYQTKSCYHFKYLRNKTGFTFAADSLTGYSTWPYVGGIDRIKQSSKFRLSPAMVRTSRLAARLFALLTRTKWKKLYRLNRCCWYVAEQLSPKVFLFLSFLSRAHCFFLFIYFLGAGSPHTLGSLVHARTLPSTRGGSRLSGTLLFHQ